MPRETLLKHDTILDKLKLKTDKSKSSPEKGGEAETNNAESKPSEVKKEASAEMAILKPVDTSE